MTWSTAKRAAASVTILAFIALGFWKFPVRQWSEDFLTWIRSFGLGGGVIYGTVYALGAVLMVPGSALTAGAGLVYGTLVGVLIVSPASVLGATVAFLVARYFARGWVEQKLQNNPRFSGMDRAVEKQGFKVVFLMRLTPILPFVLLNYALGLTRVRLRDYVIASWIGMLPATIIYVYLGSALRNVSDLFSGGVAKHSAAGLVLFWGGLAAGVLLLWVLTRAARKALQLQLDEPVAEGHAA